MKALLTALFCGLFVTSSFGFKATINITTVPSDAKIYFNGQLYGTGTAKLELSKQAKVILKVEREGYITITKTYLFKGGSRFAKSLRESYYRGQNHFTITLIKDDKYVNPLDVSTKTDSINSFIICNVDPKYNSLDAWKIATKIVTDYFDDIENNKNELGTLKTNWVPQIVGIRKIRTRLIIKIDSENPLSFKIKIQSEYSDYINAYENDDENFKEWDRVLNKYKNLIPDLYKGLSKTN